MKNLKDIIIILIFLVIIVFNVILLNINLGQINTIQHDLEYINSDEVPEGIESPKFIGKTFSQYSGNVKAISVSKACYMFATNILPEYRKECAKEDIIEYYNKHAGDIFILTGIQTQEDFCRLIKEIKKLNENLIFESYRFDFNNISINNDYIIAKLYIKYKNCDEVMVNVKIYNQVYNDRTSICFYTNK
ncbi:MAG: hypothetical protein J6D03_08930 [Clostridia bacterium]|nr:hypothetical protein [Clostridia bacterium]